MTWGYLVRACTICQCHLESDGHIVLHFEQYACWHLLNVCHLKWMVEKLHHGSKAAICSDWIWSFSRCILKCSLRTVAFCCICVSKNDSVCDKGWIYIPHRAWEQYCLFIIYKGHTSFWEQGINTGSTDLYKSNTTLVVFPRLYQSTRLKRMIYWDDKN